MLRSLLVDEQAATAIEYGLIVALIAVAVIAAMSKMGGGSQGMWTTISTRFIEATKSAGVGAS
jgi:pilus assembly protein Flp/PilA